jgi:hypothetical protein
LVKPAFSLALLLLIALFVSGCGGGSTTPAPGRGTLEGYLYDLDSNSPLEGALITVTGLSGSVSTDASGYFRLQGVTAGSQTLTVSPAGYPATTAPVTAVANQTQNIGRQFASVSGRGLAGRIVEYGAAPDRAVTVTVTNWNRGEVEYTLQTDSEGYYRITSDKYDAGDELYVSVDLSLSFSDVERDALGLATHTRINYFFTPDGVATLPPLDIYAYGLSLQSPAEGAAVTLPYNVVLNPYSRHATLKGQYYLYFYGDPGLGEGYLDVSELVWTTNAFSFDGISDDGTDLRNRYESYRYPAYTYNVGSYSIDVYRLGHQVFRDAGGSGFAVKTKTVSGPNDLPGKGRVTR